MAADVVENYHSSGTFLRNFHKHLQTHAGGKKNPSMACQIRTCAGKYIYYLNPERDEEEQLLEVDAVQSYLTGLNMR